MDKETDTQRVQIGARIRERRGPLGLTQDDLARLVGVRVQSVVKWEGGKADIKASNLIQLAEALGCSPDDLLLGEGEVAAEKPPYWDEWLAKSEVVADLSANSLRDLRVLAARNMRHSSWVDLEVIARQLDEAKATKRPRKAFEAAARRRKKP